MRPCPLLPAGPNVTCRRRGHTEHTINEFQMLTRPEDSSKCSRWTSTDPDFTALHDASTYKRGKNPNGSALICT